MRAKILTAATERFGRNGYEDTKWADIAADVGVGPTALYHYFESKQHCLFVIMEHAVLDTQRRFIATDPGSASYAEALRTVLDNYFELDDGDILRSRLLVGEQRLLARPRISPREEEARHVVCSHLRDLELTWAGFLARGMEEGLIPASDPRILARAVLGLYNSVWQWYRPTGNLSFDQAAEFFKQRIQAMIGTGESGVKSPMLAA